MAHDAVNFAGYVVGVVIWFFIIRMAIRNFRRMTAAGRGERWIHRAKESKP